MTGSYYTNEYMLDYYKHSYSYAIKDISINYLFNDKLTETSFNLEFEIIYTMIIIKQKIIMEIG